MKAPSDGGAAPSTSGKWKHNWHNMTSGKEVKHKDTPTKKQLFRHQLKDHRHMLMYFCLFIIIVVLITFVAILAIRSPQEGKECSDTPPVDHSLPASKSGTRYLVLCNSESSSPTTEEWECGANNEWMLVRNDTCECYEQPPGVTPPKMSNWKNIQSLLIGKTVKYYCTPNDMKLDNPIEIRRCGNDKTWNIVSDNKTDDCVLSDPICVGEPPAPEAGIVRVWDQIWHRVGTLVPYYCNSRNDSNLQKTVVCNQYRQWEVVYNGQCDCDKFPPGPAKGIHLLWDNDLSVGAVAMYMCNSHPTSTVLLTYMCDSDGKWKMKFRSACRMDSTLIRCEPPPHHEQIDTTHGGEILKNMTQIGSVVKYTCSDDIHHIEKTLMCGKDQKWQLIYQGSCNLYCKINLQAVSSDITRISPFNHPHSKMIGHGVTDVCASSEDNVVLSPIYQTWICNSESQWQLVVDSTCGITLPNIHCPAELPLPKGKERYYLVRKFHSLALGSIVEYSCLRDELDTLAASYKCSDWGVWIMVNSSTCRCQPPNLPKQNWFDQENPLDYFVGTSIQVYCSKTKPSPIYEIHSCGADLKWHVFAGCNCECPDPPPGEYPVTMLKPLAPGEKYYIGKGNVSYVCQEPDSLKITLTLVCQAIQLPGDGNTFRIVWKDTHKESCPEIPYECTADPPSPPSHMNWDWDYHSRKVGTIIIYYCYGDGAKVWMTTFCNKFGVWQVKSIPQSCGCLLQPPLPPPNILRVWQGPDLTFGKVVHYECTTTSDYRVLRTLACDGSGAWRTVFRGSCRKPDHAECTENFPPVWMLNKTRVRMYGKSNYSGSTITIYCQPASGMVQNYTVSVEQVYVCDAYTKSWIKVLEGRCDCDEPLTSLTIGGEKPPMMWEGHVSVGSVVKYLCPQFSSANIARQIFQCDYGKWNLIFEGACACFGYPTRPHIHSLRIWNLDNSVGQDVIFHCSNEPGAPIEIVYTCYSSGQWKVNKEKGSSDCYCNSPPPAPSPIASDWDGTPPHIGTMVSYRCTSNETSSVITTLRCSVDKEWMIISIYNWSLVDMQNLHQLRHRSRHHYANILSKAKTRFSDLDLGKFLSHCKDLLIPGNPFRVSSWAAVKKCRCDCIDDPPQLKFPITNNWIATKRRKHQGTVVWYWCTQEQRLPVRMVLVCSQDRMWRMQGTIIYCDCPQILPEEEQFRGYPIFKEPSGPPYHVGTRVYYRCTSDPAAPILAIYECIYWNEVGKGGEWLPVTASGLEACTCPAGLPLVPARSPRLVPIHEYVHGNSQNLANWIGTKIHYMCGQHHKAGEYHTVECDVDGNWKIVNFVGKCVECDEDPPTGPGIRNWDGSKVLGTIVVYQCSRSIPGPHLMDWMCDPDTRKWVKIYNGSCECELLPEVLPPPLKIQADWRHSRAKRIGSSHKVTCSGDIGSPLIDFINCTDRKLWQRTSTESWIALKKAHCTCVEPPDLRPLIAFYDFGKGSLPLFDDIGDVSRCAREAKNSCAIASGGSSFKDEETNVTLADVTSRFYIDDVVNYRCTSESASPIRRVLLCSGQRVWKEQEDHPEACTCRMNPPSPVGNEFLDWSGNHSMTIAANYRCSIHSPIVKYFQICTGKGQWERNSSTDNQCNCSSTFPMPPERVRDNLGNITVFWNGALEVFTTVRYHCSENIMSPMLMEFTCNQSNFVLDWLMTKPNVSSGFVLSELFWVSHYAEVCSCPPPPPQPTFSSVFMNMSAQRTIGATVEYQCSSEENSGFLKKLICSYNLVWVEIESDNKSDCLCVEDPPPSPSIAIAVKDWDGNRFIGTSVVYWCTEFPDAIYQILQCTSDKVWKYVEPPNTDASCLCPTPPILPKPYRLEWLNNNTKIGARVTYYCHSKKENVVLYNSVFREYECSKKRVWVLVQQNPCECPETLPSREEANIDPLILRYEPNLSRLPGSKVAAQCTADIKSPTINVFECKSNLQWKVEPTLQNLVNEHCTCRDAPPSTKEPQIRVWDGSNLMNSEVVYYCTEDLTSAIYLNLTCGTDHQWKRSSELDDYTLIRQTCYCPEPPKLPPNSRIHRFSPESTIIGSEYVERCGPTAKHPRHAKFTCVNSRKWKISEFSICICVEEPTELAGTGLYFVREYSYTFAGKSVVVRCSSLQGSPYVGTFSCNDMLTWDLIFPESGIDTSICECGPPPHPIAHEVGKQYKIGDTVLDYCEGEMEIVQATYTCLPNKTWSHQGTQDRSKCFCVEDPPQPKDPGFVGLEDIPVDKRNRVGVTITYRCSTFINAAIAMVVSCTTENEWIINVAEKNCTCPVENLEALRIEDPFYVNMSTPNRKGLAWAIHCCAQEGSPVFQYVRCNNDGEWSFLFDGELKQLANSHCECGALPHLDRTQDWIKVWTGSYLVGTVVYYNCSFSREVVALSYVCEFVSPSEGFIWRRYQYGACFCRKVPVDHDFVRDATTELGRKVDIMCNNMVDAPVKFVYECYKFPEPCPFNQSETLRCFTAKWKKLTEKNSCVCDERPPSVPFFYVTLEHALGFPGTSVKTLKKDAPKPYFGSRAYYRCSRNRTSVIIQVLRCSANNQWQVDYGVKVLNKEACKCPEKVDAPNFPAPPKEILVNSSRMNRTMGVKIPIVCNKNYPRLKYGLLICGLDKRWHVKELGESCSCNQRKIPLLDSPLKIILEHFMPSDPRNWLVGVKHKVVCHSDFGDLPYGSLLCNGQKKWVLAAENACMCPSDPPMPPSAETAIRQWNHIRLVGTVVEYTCHRSLSSPVVERATCVQKKNQPLKTSWVLEAGNWERVPELCYCPTPPPPPEPHLTLVWNTRRRIGTVARYECAKNIINYEMTCSIDRIWRRSRDVHTCKCSENVPVLLPAIPLSVSNEIGDVVQYSCTSNIADGLYRIYVCNTTFQWQKIMEYSCVCNEEPEIPPPPVYMEVLYYYDSGASGYYVGSIVKYKCSSLSNSVVIRDLKCTHVDRAENKLWKVISERRRLQTGLAILTWEELVTANCLCKDEPPEPMYGIGWDWTNKTRNEHDIVKYYCSYAVSLVPRYKDRFKPVAEAVCLPDKTWSLEMIEESWLEIVQYHCSCEKPHALPVTGVYASWQGPRNRVGSIITYWCQPYEFYVRLTCEDNKTWVPIEEGNCDKYYCAASFNKKYQCLSDSNVRYNYFDAKNACHRQNKSLVAIRSIEMNEQVVRCSFPSKPSCLEVGYYIGASYNHEQSRWVYETNLPFGTFNNFKRDRLHGEDCAIIDHRGLWIPVKCSGKYCFICALDAPDNNYLGCNRIKNVPITITN